MLSGQMDLLVTIKWTDWPIQFMQLSILKNYSGPCVFFSGTPSKNIITWYLGRPAVQINVCYVVMYEDIFY